MKNKQNSTNALNGKKKNFINAFLSEGCNISKACKAADIDRGTYYIWMEKFQEFKAEIEEAQEKLLDFTESKLVENIQTNDTRAIIFMLKTKGKKRGYVERMETEVSGSLKIETITGMEII